MTQEIESTLERLGREDKERENKHSKYKKNKKKFFEQRSMSADEKRLAIRNAKKNAETAFHKLIELMEEAVVRMHTIAKKSIEALYEQYIHGRQTLNSLLYCAIRFFNRKNNNVIASYSQRQDHIEFIALY